MKKVAFLSTLILALFLLTSLAIAEEKKIHVGIILPLTGEAASMGTAVKNGFTLGLEKIPPTVLSRLELHYEDDALQPKNSVSALNKLISQNKVDILINASSGTGKALSPIAEQKQIPLISIATDSKISEGKKYAFNFWVTPEEQTRVAFPEVLKRGYKKIARIITIQDGALAMKATFDARNKGEIEVVLDEEYTSDVKDFKPFITKLRTHKDLDAIMVILLPGQCGIFAKQARQLGIKQDLFSYEIFEDSNEVKASEGALIGQWYVNGDDADEAFLKEYRQRFPDASPWGASTGHDAALIIGEAVAKGYTKANFHEFLAGLKDFTGAMGTYSSTGNQKFSLPAAIKVVTKDGFEKLYK